MRPIVLTVSGEKRARRQAVTATWIAVGGLALFATYQARELADAREALSRTPEVSAVKSVVLGATASGSAEELALERVLRAHAAARFAGWGDTLSSLAQALPSGATIERLTLNAKTRRGDASVRVGRVEEVSRIVEVLERAPSLSSVSARRCEQARARDQLGMRCELGFIWAGREQ